jgi:ATP/maltotriose-dependent transcriptional regulator MalT
MQSAYDPAAIPVDAMNLLLNDEDPWVRAQTRLNLARVLGSSGGRHAEAEADILAALAEFRAIGERWGISFALSTLADLLAQRGELAAALAYYDEAIGVVTEIGTVEDVLWMRGRQAQLRWLSGDQAGSAAALAAAERDAARIGWPDALAGLAMAKAELARWQGDLDAARAELARAEAAVRHITVHPVFSAMSLDSHGYLDALAGDLGSARTKRAEALALAVGSRHAPTVARVLIGVADLALHQGLPHDAARLLAASVAVRGTPDLSSPDAARVAEAARAALGEQEFTEAARRGAAATIETVLEIAAVTLGG